MIGYENPSTLWSSLVESPYLWIIVYFRRIGGRIVSFYKILIPIEDQPRAGAASQSMTESQQSLILKIKNYLGISINRYAS